jgi:hypothetical protein
LSIGGTGIHAVIRLRSEKLKGSKGTDHIYMYEGKKMRFLLFYVFLPSGCYFNTKN